MKALIFNNKVVDVKETPFEVSESMTWVNCPDDTKIGAAYSDGTFTAKTYPTLTYDKQRKRAYPAFYEFAEAYTEKEIGEDSTKWDAYVTKYNKVRSDYPKS